MSVRLEHANLAVRDLGVMIEFIRAAFPDFRIRGEGRTFTGTRWVHVGNDETYLALSEARVETSERWVPYAGKPGLNHLGYEVDDAEALRERMLAGGYTESTVPNSHPHRRRIYFHDPEGNDWEFVQYATADFAKRNDYELPDF
ncbi:MAG: VOC family protein [Proteobacteria bacterium]|nr:VOC family protein [Pseudomonadota bacterium]